MVSITSCAFSSLYFINLRRFVWSENTSINRETTSGTVSFEGCAEENDWDPRMELSASLFSFNLCKIAFSVVYSGREQVSVSTT